MLIYVSDTEDGRSIALLSESFALIFKQAANNSCAIELVSKNELKNKNYKKLSKHEIFGFIGLIEIDSNIFISTITGSSKVASPTPGETINKIYAVDFFCLTDSRWDFSELDIQGRPLNSMDPEGVDLETEHPSLQQQEPLQQHPCFTLKKLLSNGSFYYSSDFDLTSMLQNRGFGEYSLSKDNFEKEYMWNHFMMNEIINYRDRLDSNAKQILDEEGFLTTVIRGFAKTVTTTVNRLKVSLTIISKQSWGRAGTRFNVRGINDTGNVANFVETEFIMYSKEYCFSFTEVRGSVPIFWEQDASLINPKIQITRSAEATQQAFDCHFTKLLEKYGPTNIINLLSTKVSEQELTRRYRKQLSVSKVATENPNDICLTEFDFNRETAQLGFQAALKLVPLIENNLLDFGYYSYDVKENKTVSKQQGIFRTNCLDCLDRTNLVQQLISSQIFKIFLDDFKLFQYDRIYDELEFMQAHNNLWADNGDQISQIYTGTNALKSSFTRKGKMSFAGALSDATKSVSRMYINNFMDKGKQQNIDALLGRLPNQRPVKVYDPESDYVLEQLRELAPTYTSFANMNLLIGTFNANGMSTRTADLSKWLFPIGENFKPDVVLLGLQEVIELTAGSILNADYTKGSYWENIVSSCLNQYDEKYILLRVEQMASLIILLFVKEDKISLIKHVEGCTKKTGFRGMTGNKGAVAIRFEYGDTSFCFVNAHLSAGSKNIENRAHDYMTIDKSIAFSGGRAIAQHDTIFWLGDLNYRISLPNDQVRQELTEQKEGYIQRLLQYDQLTEALNSGVVFKDFCEPTFEFHPTYKYDFGTDIYDTSEKARTPSWTDRIIYKGDNLFPMAYADAPLKLSDHKPVYAAYRSKITFIDEAKKYDLTKRLYATYKNNEGSNIKNESNFLKKPKDHFTDVKLLQSKVNCNEVKPKLIRAPSNSSLSTSSTLLSESSDVGPKQSPLIPSKPIEMKVMSKGRKGASPPILPKRKRTIDIDTAEEKEQEKEQEFSTDVSKRVEAKSPDQDPHSRLPPPPPPVSRSSASLSSKNYNNNENDVDLIEMNSTSSSQNIETTALRTRRALPPVPKPRVSGNENIEVKKRDGTQQSSMEAKIELSPASSSILEMVIDSTDSTPIKQRSNSVMKDIINDSPVRDKKKGPPPVPTKKPQLEKIKIEHH